MNINADMIPMTLANMSYCHDILSKTGLRKLPKELRESEMAKNEIKLHVHTFHFFMYFPVFLANARSDFLVVLSRLYSCAFEFVIFFSCGF